MNIIDLKKEDFLKIQNDFLQTSFARNNFWSSSFLQSYQWAEIQENYGWPVLFKGIKKDEKIIGFFLAIEKKIWQSKRYWYIPRGPIFFDNQVSWLDFFFALQQQVNDKNIKFVRFEPLSPDFLDYYNDKGSRTKGQLSVNLIKSSDIQPVKTSFLNLNLPETELLNSFSQKTRYNINLAMKKGVEVSVESLDGFADFWKLMSVTSGRDNFFIHSEKYYRTLLSGPGDYIKLLTARFQGEALAVGIFSFFGPTASYLHGASSNEKRNLMAPHLLQWTAIKIAQDNDCRFYDFYGVDEKKWPGVSRFKNGFSGEKFSFPGTFDYILDSKFYSLYKFFRQSKKIIKSKVNNIKKIF